MENRNNIKNGKLLFQSPYLKIIHILSPNAVYYKLSSYLEKTDAPEFFERMTDAIEKTGAKYIVSDLSDFKGCNLSLAKHANDVWMPVIAGKGITHVAMNHPESDFGAFISKIAAGKKAQDLICFKKFRELEEAFIWISELETKA